MFIIRYLFFLFLIHFVCPASSAQNSIKSFFKDEPNQNRNVIQQELFILGTNALNDGNLMTADSIFNLFEENDGFPDLWFNSAVTKLLLNDTCGFCRKIHHSYKENDTLIKSIFENHCVLQDTTYTNYTWQETMDRQTKFFIIRYTLKCPDDTLYALMDKHFKTVNKKRVIRYKNFYLITNFVKALYRNYQDKKYYIIASKECSVKDNMMSIHEMLMSQLSKKFTEHELRKFPVTQFTLHIDEQGKLVDFEFDRQSNVKLKIELSEIIQHKIKFEPAYFNDQAVASEVWCNLNFIDFWIK